MGPKTIQKADFCPMNIEPFISCISDPPPWYSGSKVFVKEESFGSESKCFNSDFGKPLCLTSYCDFKVGSIRVKFGESSFRCEYDGQKVSVESSGRTIQIECPKRAVLCPDMICPQDCVGTGVCNWNRTLPMCEPIDTDHVEKIGKEDTIAPSSQPSNRDTTLHIYLPPPEISQKTLNPSLVPAPSSTPTNYQNNIKQINNAGAATKANSKGNICKPSQLQYMVLALILFGSNIL